MCCSNEDSAWHGSATGWSVAFALACCASVLGQQRPERYTLAFKAFPPSNTDIFIAAGDGTAARPLAPDPALDYNASLSPDGRWVLFTSHRGGSADLYRVRPDGSALERLTDDPAFDDQGAFSPDGRRVAFVSTRAGRADIWTLDLQTRQAHVVVSDPAGDFRPAWSPDGEWLAFVSDREPVGTSCPNTDQPGPGPFVTPQYTSIFVARADGSHTRRITSASESAGGPRWSPDGRHLLAYVSAAEHICGGGMMFGRGPSQIVSIEFPSGRREVVTRGPGLKVIPGSTADGRFAYVTRTGVAFSDRQSETAGEFGRPAWSREGSTMVFHREIDRNRDQDRDFKTWHSPDPRFNLLRLNGHTSFSASGDRMVFSVTNYAGDVRNGLLVVAIPTDRTVAPFMKDRSPTTSPGRHGLLAATRSCSDSADSSSVHRFAPLAS